MQYTESYEVVDKSIEPCPPVPFQTEAAALEYLNAMTSRLRHPYSYELVRVQRMSIMATISSGKITR